MVATLGCPADPVIIHKPKIFGAELTFSYEGEKTAQRKPVGVLTADPEKVLSLGSAAY